MPLTRTSFPFSALWLSALLAVGPVACNCGGTTEIHTSGDAGVDAGGEEVDSGDPLMDLDGSTQLEDGGFVRPDGGPTDFGDGGCAPQDAGPGPQARRCAPAADNECVGAVDTFLSGAGVPSGRLNNATGNGFDDDCDGLVDEGCTCPGLGQTKDCYLVPATQASNTTNLPVGWCTNNAKGSLDCVGFESTSWSGTCRGAQPPYPNDACQPGDFNCDGLEMNNAISGCQCGMDAVKCPTDEIVAKPFPKADALSSIDGTKWIEDPAKRALATDWVWTVIGGDCDNVLPHPTYAIYKGANSATAARIGARTAVKYDTTKGAYVVDATSKTISLRTAASGTAAATGVIYPAFAVSGDYLVQADFKLNGKSYSCTQKVAVRAPGIRAELCWDTVGGTGNSNAGNDIDLHFARLQNVAACAAEGWNRTCLDNNAFQDCYFDPYVGCAGDSDSPPEWRGLGSSTAYPNSANTACQGWGSKRKATDLQKCTNPRLDKDNIACDPAADNPLAANFCSAENINLDNPSNGDRFVVGVHHFGNNGGSASAKPHVNLYCNGVRVLSAGYNPVSGETSFPLLKTPSSNQLGVADGDFWTVATIRATVSGGQISKCDVTSLGSRHADPTRDGPAAVVGGGNSVCIDSKSNQTPAPNQFSYKTWRFIDTGSTQGGTSGAEPSSAGQWCKH